MCAICMQVNEAPTADHIFDLLVELLTEGLEQTEAKLAERIVGAGSDGCSVMLGHVNGVMAQLRSQLAPHATNQHCAAHRTNLAADSMNNNPLARPGAPSGRDLADCTCTLHMYSVG